MKKILLLTCGTNACYHFAKTLKENFPNDFFIIGADINKNWLIPTAPFLDEFYQCPLSSSKDYYGFIIDICKRCKPDYLIPSFDDDQKLFYPENKDLLGLGVKSLGTPLETIEKFYKDKIVATNFLREYDFPVPKMFSLEEIQEDGNYFVKPIHGVGSVGARLVYGKELKQLSGNLIIQEVCTEPEITLECFYDKVSGYFSSIARNRIAAKAGVCTKAKIFNDEKLSCIAKKIAKTVDTPCYFNLQFMQNCKAEFVITDVNLRMAGGMSLGYAGGWDAVGAVAELLLHGDSSASNRKSILEKKVPRKINPQFIVRAYTDIVTKKIKKSVAFDLDGTLLDSRLRHKIVMDDVLSEFGLKLETSDLVSFKSAGKNNVDWLLSKGIEKARAQKIQRRWVEIIEDKKYLDSDKLYEGALELLRSLSRDNSLYLVTARSKKDAVLRQISDLGIVRYFDDICVVCGKNASFEKAEFLKTNSVEIMVGDTEVDFDAAETAGCEFIPVSYGFRNMEFWEKYKKQTAGCIGKTTALQMGKGGILNQMLNRNYYTNNGGGGITVE